MVPIWIILGLIISGTSVSMLGAYFSIHGLGALFSGALLAIWLMAGSLELSKFVLAAYLHRKWHELNTLYKSYLVSSVVILSLITSMGIFGFLSEAYQSASSVLEAENIKLASLETQVSSAKNEIARLNNSINEIPANRITKRLQARKEMEPAIAELNKKVDQYHLEIAAANLTIIEVKKKVGPLIYISRAFNVDIDNVVKYLILVFVLVFDPLAICLVIAISEALASRSRQPTAVAAPSQNLEPLNASHLPVEPTPVSDELIQMSFVDDDKTAV